MATKVKESMKSHHKLEHTHHDAMARHHKKMALKHKKLSDKLGNTGSKYPVDAPAGNARGKMC